MHGGGGLVDDEASEVAVADKVSDGVDAWFGGANVVVDDVVVVASFVLSLHTILQLNPSKPRPSRPLPPMTPSSSLALALNNMATALPP